MEEISTGNMKLQPLIGRNQSEVPFIGLMLQTPECFPCPGNKAGRAGDRSVAQNHISHDCQHHTTMTCFTSFVPVSLNKSEREYISEELNLIGCVRLFCRMTLEVNILFCGSFSNTVCVCVCSPPAGLGLRPGRTGPGALRALLLPLLLLHLRPG